MKDQNQTDQNKETTTPIASGVAPGPGEHLIDASSQPSIASSTPGDSVGASGRAGMDATGLYGGTSSDLGSNTSRTSRASTQGARQRESLPYETATSERYDSLRGYDTSTYGDQSASQASMLQSAASQLSGSRGAFLAGTVIAGFLLQRFLQASPAKRSSQRYQTYRSDTSGLGYGTDASLDAERPYGVDSAYAADTSYGAGSSTGSGMSSTGTLNRVTDRVKQASDTARTRLQSTTADAKSRLNDMSHTTKTQYYRAKHRVDTMKDEQPLLIGALGIALGAGLGSMLAVTRKENELLGGVRDNLMGKAKEIASTQMQTVKESAQRLTEAAKQEAQRTKDEMAAKVTQGSAQSGTGNSGTTGQSIH
ncbi:hypothetical protein [Noviherbaspirillum aerium]|uniref:hypothetical protein n=1 Tax=Noviherbaspirillum aerium TaxID=2588497 RepID=UPI00124C751C|nr:hypothetical protein [Noviherbaspirillum aerium]